MNSNHCQLFTILIGFGQPPPFPTVHLSSFINAGTLIFKTLIIRGFIIVLSQYTTKIP